MPLLFNIGFETRPRTAPDLGQSVGTACGLLSPTTSSTSFALAAAAPFHLDIPSTHPGMRWLFLSPGDRDGTPIPPKEMADFVKLVGNFSTHGDVASLRALEKTARGTSAIAGLAQAALRTDLNDFSLLANRAAREPEAFIALSEVCFRYGNPAAVKALIQGRYVALEKFIGINCPQEYIVLDLALKVTQVLGVPAQHCPAETRIPSRREALGNLESIAHFAHTDDGFLRHFSRYPDLLARIHDFFSMVAVCQPMSIEGFGTFLLSHPVAAERCRDVLTPYARLKNVSIVWPDFVGAVAQKKIPEINVPKAAALLSSGRGSDAVAAFQTLYERAVMPSGAPLREEAIHALQTAPLDVAAWQMLAENTGGNLEAATRAWEALALMGLMYDNSRARASLTKANLAPYALDPSLRIIGVGESLPLLWTGLARLWGNQALDASAAGGILRLQVVMARFTGHYEDMLLPSLFDEKKYLEDLAMGRITPEARKIHDVLAALAAKPKQSPRFVREVESNVGMASNYVHLISSVTDSLQIGGTQQVLSPWITQLAGRIIGDEVLAGTHEGRLLAINFGVPAQSNALLCRMVFSKLRDNPDHLLRFLVFLSRHRNILHIMDEGFRVVFGDIKGKKSINAEEVLEALATVQPLGRRLETAVAVYHLHNEIPGMRKAIGTNRPEVFLSEELLELVTTLTETLGDLRNLQLKDLENETLRNEFLNSAAWKLVSLGFLALHPETKLPTDDSPEFLKLFTDKRDADRSLRQWSLIEANINYAEMGLIFLLQYLFSGHGLSEDEIAAMAHRLVDHRIFDHTGDRFREIIREILQKIAEKAHHDSHGTSGSSGTSARPSDFS